MDEPSFRSFQPDDLRSCARFAADAWPVVSALTPADDVNRLMSAYVEIARLGSSWQEVACVSGEVRGLLFGRIHADYSWPRAAWATLVSLSLGLQIILGKYGRLAHPRTFLQKYVATEMQAEKHSPKSEASVELFVVDSLVRGRGIGRALLDRFVAVAKAKGIKAITLYTDPLSNWGFYEKYGFRRYDVFDDALNSYITGEAMKSFIYVLELDRAQVIV